MSGELQRDEAAVSGAMQGGVVRDELKKADPRIWGHCWGLVFHPKGHYDVKQGSDADRVCLGGQA